VGAPAPPRAVKTIFFRRNLQGKCVSAPLARAGVNFRTIFAGRVRFGGVFRRSGHGPVVWNSLPHDLRSTDISLATFRN